MRLFASPVVPTLLALGCLLLAAPGRAQTASSSAPAGTPAALGLGAVTASTLPNGLQVLVAPSQATDLVTVDVWLGAGTRRETAENNGVAHFIEHLLFKGTPTRKPGEIDAAIENLGGSLNAATSYDWAHFYVTVGAADAEAALTVLADAVSNASLRQEDMDAERPVILSEMAHTLDSPVERVTQNLNALLFPGHPYGRPLLGTEEHLTQMRRQTLLDFYHTYYVPGNTTLVLTGNLTPEAGLAMAQRALGKWPARPFPADKSLPEPPQTLFQQSLTAPVNRGFLALGFHAPSVRDKPDTYVMDVLLTWLGQGGNNRLQETLQHQQKLVSFINANYLTQHDGGALSITAMFDLSQDPVKVRDAILAQIAALRDAPLAPEDLSAVKHALLASYLFDAQTTSGRADALGFYNIIDTYQYDTNYIANFMGVTAAQVQGIARKYLDPKAVTLVTLMPRANLLTASSSTRLRSGVLSCFTAGSHSSSGR